MAQKQFKIGLSNTDKQNMAQDVYERLLALTFPEYDASTQYSVGDFVVYNDQLYKCISATSGAWDSSKWQLATLNDLVADIEGAVAFVNDKANVNGNYPTMTVGVADNLSPYDEEAGIKQSAPFNFQASGTNNGANPLATVGELALLKEKRGNSVVVNQLARPLNATYWNAYQGTPTFTDGTCELTPIVDAQYPGIIQTTLLPKSGHYYLVNLDFKGEATLNINFGGVDTQIASGLNASVFTNITKLVLCNNESAYLQLFVVDGTNVQNYKNIICIDLTQWFGSNDNIPAHLLSHQEDFFRYYQGSLAYNEGELVNANGRYIKCIGRNQCDESQITDNAYVDYQTGELVTNASPDYCASPFIKIIPNTFYYLYEGGNYYSEWMAYYDKDKNFIGGLSYYPTNNAVKAPANACYIRFSLKMAEKGKICFSIYYSGESGYDKHYPYEVLTNTDIGTETLRSAGNVADIKLPSGEIKRNVGTYTFTGNESWTLRSSDTDFDYYFCASLLSANAKPNLLSKGICSNGAVFEGGAYINATELAIGIDNATIYIAVPSGANPNTIFASGVILNYELSDTYTEQGTPFSENVEIDDFGSMSFEGTNGVPQGNLIFYPVDYKAYLDTLHKHTDGDPDNLALKSELNAKFESYLKSLSGYDASETQVLKNISGTLTWVTEGE